MFDIPLRVPFPRPDVIRRLNMVVIMSKILNPGENCFGIYGVEQNGIVIDARAYYRAFYHAAAEARSYILLAGWQFDSDVLLVRGEDAPGTGAPVTLLDHLVFLCDRNPDLQVYVLAWDFSLLYSYDRQWFQDVTYSWTSRGRIRFVFDKVHAVGASHHQKFVVIDGCLGFVGGLDICSGHWDDRDHSDGKPHRFDSNGQLHDPYHDVQAFCTGAAARRLADLFVERWTVASGIPLELPPPAHGNGPVVGPSFTFPAERVAFSRTVGKMILPLQEPVSEIRRLYIDAINSAREVIYIETQYFTSQAVFQALVDRMESNDSPKPEIVIVLPREMHAFFEEFSLGLAQMKMVKALQERAEKAGEHLGMYWTAAGGSEKQTYIHSKLMIVDDRFFTVGSANCTNRSMGLDSELNISWEADEWDAHLSRSIRRVRISLLSEHCGILHPLQARWFYRTKDLVARLDRLAASGITRLRPFDPEYSLHDKEWLKRISPEKSSLDSEKPLVEELLFEEISDSSTSLFSRGIMSLNHWLTTGAQRSSGAAEPVPAGDGKPAEEEK